MPNHGKCIWACKDGIFIKNNNSNSTQEAKVVS